VQNKEVDQLLINQGLNLALLSQANGFWLENNFKITLKNFVRLGVKFFQHQGN